MTDLSQADLAEPDRTEPEPPYRLELQVWPAHSGQVWAASLAGCAPHGHALERREFGSLIDLMRFLEALVTNSGLR